MGVVFFWTIFEALNRGRHGTGSRSGSSRGRASAIGSCASVSTVASYQSSSQIVSGRINCVYVKCMQRESWWGHWWGHWCDIYTYMPIALFYVQYIRSCLSAFLLVVLKRSGSARNVDNIIWMFLTIGVLFEGSRRANPARSRKRLFLTLRWISGVGVVFFWTII